MDGIVLLDEQQQRCFNNADGVVLLDHAQQRTLLDSQTAHTADPTTSLPSSRRCCVSESHTTITNTSSSKPSIATIGSSPRSNFTSRGGQPSINVPPTHRESFKHDGANPWMFDDTPGASLGDVYGGAGAGSGSELSQIMPLRSVFIGVFVGLILGLILTYSGAPPLVSTWLGLPSTLFVRALQCVVVPYVFCSVAVAIGDIVFVGKISIVGFQTAKIFVLEWLATAAMGLGVALLFRPFFHFKEHSPASALNSMGMQCKNYELLTMQTNGSVACMTRNTAATLPSNATFTVHDSNHAIKQNALSSIAKLSLSDLLQLMVKHVVPNNLFTSFVNNELLSIICFATLLGAIAGRNHFNRTRPVNYLYLTLLQCRDALFLLLEWTIASTPIVLVSFISSFMAANKDAFGQFTHAYFYVLASLFAALLQVFIVLPAIVFLMTRCNPYNHMRQMVHAYVFAFACSSSIATAPITLNCIQRARVCSQSLSNFVISVGVCSNTSAGGFYVPIAVVFLAESAGDQGQLTVARLVGLYVLSVIACVGTPPIPAGGLVTVQSIYSALFGVSEMPAGIVYVIAFDFIFDRIATVCNVNDDIMAIKIIAENTDETVAQVQLGHRL